jgi:hypothetical protein
MAKFKKGDKVKIRLDNASPYRGRKGIVNDDASEDSYGFWYMVKFESRGFSPSSRFNEKDLEATDI